MIRRLRLENWKAYENLDLSFGAGATFVVAQNGVGKSSLMQGLIYGLYGETALGFPAEKARRAGAQSSTVEVTVELPGGVTLVVARHLAAPKKSGSRVRHKVEATVNGEPITGDQMTTELSARLGAAVDQLPSLTVLKEGDVLREGDSGPSFNVVAHLSSLLGVDRATSTATQLDRLESQQSRAGDAFRRDDPGLEATEQLNERRAEVERSLVALRERFSGESESLTRSKRLLDNSKVWDAFRAAEEVDRRRFASIASEVAALFSEPALTRAQQVVPEHELSQQQAFGSFDSVHGAVDGALDLLRNADRRVAEERSAAAALLTRAQTARAALMEAGAVCPVCRRPLSPDEAKRAAADIDHEIGELERRSQSEQAGGDDLQSLIQRLVAIERQAHRTAGAEPSEPQPPESVADLEVLVLAQQAKCDDVRLEGLRLREVLADVDRQISERIELARANVESVKAYRQAAVANLVAATLRSVAEALCAQQIDPLARELHKRWEQLWPAPTDLRLEPNGQLSLRLGEETIGFHHFSGGEKTMAVVMLRMLALQMLTRAGFLLLDEPLEHLDPRNRRMLAKLLVRASGPGPLDQVIVTTYEESVARALGSGVLGQSSASVLYVKTSPSADQ